MVRAGSVDGVVRAGSVDGVVRAGSVDGVVRAGSVDGVVRAGSVDGVVRASGLAVALHEPGSRVPGDRARCARLAADHRSVARHHLRQSGGLVGEVDNDDDVVAAPEREHAVHGIDPLDRGAGRCHRATADPEGPPVERQRRRRIGILGGDGDRDPTRRLGEPRRPRRPEAERRFGA